MVLLGLIRSYDLISLFKKCVSCKRFRGDCFLTVKDVHRVEFMRHQNSFRFLPAYMWNVVDV